MKKKTFRIHKPVMKWQTGDFRRSQNYQFELPHQFLLLCRLMDITPEQLLIDFMDNLSFGSWKREGRDKARQSLVEYFLEHGYGQQHYSIEEIRAMFREMDAVGLLYPRDADTELVDTYSQWREKHLEYWFNKWFNKYRRELHP